MVSGKIFKDSDKAALRDYGRKPIIMSHDLHERDMFSDEGLADLLERYPRDELGVYTMGDDPEDWRTFVKGEAGDLSGEELLKLVREGRIWFNLRAVDQHLEDYAELREQMFREFDALTGQPTLKQDLGVLISSPKVQVFYHADIPFVLLWQIRGVKKVWIYPSTPDFAPDEALEAIVLKEAEEEFEYRPEFDEHAFVIDLEPGMLANWPLNGPHRIENHDMLCVSLSVEYQTMPALAHANMLYYNGYMRRRFGAKPDRSRDTGARMWAKAAAARVIKLAGGRNVFRKDTKAAFRLDPESEGGVRFFQEGETA